MFLGSLHSMDSAIACGAIGRRFESGRARYLIGAELLGFMILVLKLKKAYYIFKE